MLSIPIVTEYNGAGIKKAIKEFKQLETTGQKASFALKKAALPAAAAFGALAAGLFDATKAAIQDEAAQQALARQIRRSTKATDAQIAANEDWISTQGKLLGITDDELRPALAGLVRVTGSITKAQKAAALAMDISAGKGISLETTTKALERAYGGNLNALAKIAPELKDMIKEGATLEQVMDKLNKKFGGEAAAAAGTTEGKFRTLKVSFDETKEALGAGLLPVMDELLPLLEDFAAWAEDNPETFKAIALSIGAITVATLALNAAASVNPYVAGIAGIIALSAAYDKLYKSLDKISKLGGNAARLLGILLGGPSQGEGLEDILGGIRGRFSNRDNITPSVPTPSPTTNVPSIRPSTFANGRMMTSSGNTVNISGLITDPVAVGLQVSSVLNRSSRRSGGRS